MSEIRTYKLVSASGVARTAIFEGRPHLVVPVIALMEGVIHAVNAETPEFVPLSTLEKAAATWNNRPAVLFHPKRDGRQCSANSPDVLAESGLGYVFNAKVVGRKLHCEAWIDKAKASRLHPEMYRGLQNGETVEVSVGAYVITDDTPGVFGGKPYYSSWVEVVGDHLAFLPGGRGACSVEMGCGTHRAASGKCPTHDLVKVLAALPEKAQVVMDKGKKKKDCSGCNGSGNKNGNPCDVCNGTGKIRAAGTCSCESGSAAAKPQLKAAGCGCHHTGVKAMEKSTRAELIAELVTDRYSGFRDGDEAILEAASDARLEEFRTASENRKSQERSAARLETDLTNTSARLKVAEERLKTAEAGMTEEEWLAQAPPFFKTLLENHKAEEDATRASIISQLKDCGANTEEELRAMDTKQLKTLAAYARVEVPDFSGRGIPQERHASANAKENFTPPNPYEAGLKALRGGSKTVN